MVPLTRGNAGADDVFERMLNYADQAVHEVAAAFEPPWRDYGKELVEIRRRIRGAAAAALAGCDRPALEIARRFHRAGRWFVYGAVVEDPTGRIAQLARTCPGALLLASALRRREELEEADAILRAAARGKPLRAVVSEVVERWAGLLEHQDVEREWPPWPKDRRCLDTTSQALLIRRAGPQVDPEHLIVRPLPSFAPEDIPARADRNAAWFRVMAGASRSLAGAEELADGLSAFVACHHRAVLADSRRGPPVYDEDEPGGEVHRLVDRLARFSRATGRRPGRHSNPSRILAEARRWVNDEEDAHSPAFRLGRLLDRVRKLGLGPVVAVRELGSSIDWGRVGVLELPCWPYGDISVPGVTASHIGSAAALAEEAAAMDHRVSTLLPDIMAGQLYLFAVRAGASRLTVALRPRLLEGYEFLEARGQGDRLPFRAEMAAINRWLGAVNDRAAAPSQGSCFAGDCGR